MEEEGAMEHQPEKYPPAYSLVEVTLALGIFAAGILSLLGILIPALDQARTTRTNLAASRAVSALSAALRLLDYDPEVGPFDEVYAGVHAAPAHFYIFTGGAGNLVITPLEREVIAVDGVLLGAKVAVSGNNPSQHLIRNGDTHTLSLPDPDLYPEGYLALKVDLHELIPPAGAASFDASKWDDSRYLFTFHTAVTR